MIWSLLNYLMHVNVITFRLQFTPFITFTVGNVPIHYWNGSYKSLLAGQCHQINLFYLPIYSQVKALLSTEQLPDIWCLVNQSAEFQRYFQLVEVLLNQEATEFSVADFIEAVSSAPE